MAAEKNEFWLDDGELVEWGMDLMTDHYPEALNTKVCYMWRTKAAKSGGKLQMGQCQRQSDQQKKLHGYDFVIVIAADAWSALAPKQREALLLHEILHIGVEFDESGEDDGRKYFLRPHDCEEFSDVIRAYGLWRDEVKDVASAIQAVSE